MHLIGGLTTDRTTFLSILDASATMKPSKRYGYSQPWWQVGCCMQWTTLQILQ